MSIFSYFSRPIREDTAVTIEIRLYVKNKRNPTIRIIFGNLVRRPVSLYPTSIVGCSLYYYNKLLQRIANDYRQYRLQHTTIRIFIHLSYKYASYNVHLDFKRAIRTNCACNYDDAV